MVLLVSGKALPLNGESRRIRIGLPGLRWARTIRNPGWTPLANRCDKQSFPLRAATTDSRSDSVRCTPGAWRSNPCVEVAAPFPPRADSKGVKLALRATWPTACSGLREEASLLLQTSIAALNAFARQ